MHIMDMTVLTLKSLEDQETVDYHTTVIVCVRGRSSKVGVVLFSVMYSPSQPHPEKGPG